MGTYANARCSAKHSSTVRPILLTIFQATNVTVQNIRMINGPEWINFVRLKYIHTYGSNC